MLKCVFGNVDKSRNSGNFCDNLTNFILQYEPYE